MFCNLHLTELSFLFQQHTGDFSWPMTVTEAPLVLCCVVGSPALPSGQNMEFGLLLGQVYILNKPTNCPHSISLCPDPLLGDCQCCPSPLPTQAHHLCPHTLHRCFLPQLTGLIRMVSLASLPLVDLLYIISMQGDCWMGSGGFKPSADEPVLEWKRIKHYCANGNKAHGDRVSQTRWV